MFILDNLGNMDNCQKRMNHDLTTQNEALFIFWYLYFQFMCLCVCVLVFTQNFVPDIV